jgi:hypothetical protein
MLMQDYEEFSLPQAVASLLNTPRSLRHALSRTFFAWHTLHGEIDFNHLLAVNILRFVFQRVCSGGFPTHKARYCYVKSGE